MSSQTLPSTTPDSHEVIRYIRFLEDAILRAPLAADGPPSEPADLAAAVWPQPALGPAAASSDLVFFRTVHANLNAAAQHAEMGHEAQSFRECSHSMCQDARKLIPSLAEPGATDAELNAIFERALARCFS